MDSALADCPRTAPGRPPAGRSRCSARSNPSRDVVVQTLFGRFRDIGRSRRPVVAGPSRRSAAVTSTRCVAWTGSGSTTGLLPAASSAPQRPRPLAWPGHWHGLVSTTNISLPRPPRSRRRPPASTATPATSACPKPLRAFSRSPRTISRRHLADHDCFGRRHPWAGISLTDLGDRDRNALSRSAPIGPGGQCHSARRRRHEQFRRPECRHHPLRRHGRVRWIADDAAPQHRRRPFISCPHGAGDKATAALAGPSGSLSSIGSTPASQPIAAPAGHFATQLQAFIPATRAARSIFPTRPTSNRKSAHWSAAS